MSQLTNKQRKEVRESAGRYGRQAESGQYSPGRIAVVAIAALALLATRLVPGLDPLIAAGLTYGSFGLLLGTMYLARQAQSQSQQRAPRPVRVRVSEDRQGDERSRPFAGR